MYKPSLYRPLAGTVSLSLALALLASPVHGFQKTQSVFQIKPALQTKFAKERGIVLPGSAVKDQIQTYSPSKFLTEINRKEENPAQYQSFLYEVRDGRKDVEEAKLVAANLLYTAVESNWGIISTTQFNDKAINGKKGMGLLLNRKFEQLNYLPSKDGNKDPRKSTYTFEAGDWGVVKLVKNLKTKKFEVATWSLDISSTMDENVIAPEAENIAIAPAKDK